MELIRERDLIALWPVLLFAVVMGLGISALAPAQQPTATKAATTASDILAD